MITLTEQEVARRKLALEDAIASVRLEGLEPTPQTIEDLNGVVRGEFDVEEVVRRIKERLALGYYEKR